MRQTIWLGGALAIGIIVGAAGYHLFDPGVHTSTADSVAEDGKGEPLYWVAPMDPNYRRSEPGKSPMGMDLVPVYAEDAMDKGSVRVSPAVAHSIGVRTAPVRRGRLHHTLTTVAYVRYDEDLLWHAHLRVEGWIDRLYVKSVGEEVDAGDPLYEIYSPTLVNAQEEYASAIRAGNGTLIEAAEDRLRSLNVPDEYIDRVREEGIISQSITMRTPRSGVVSSLGVRHGHYVTPGTAIMEVAGLETVWVTAEVFESDVASVDIGDAVDFRFGYRPGETYRASIDFVNPVLESMTRTLQVRATLPNPDRKLKPNMFAEATIHVEGAREVILAPREAIIRTQSQDRAVLALGDNRFKSVAIRLGRVSDDHAEILDGLKEGDHIVTSAQFLIDSESSISSDFERMDLTPVDSDSMENRTTDHDGMDRDTTDHDGMDHGTTDHDPDSGIHQAGGH